MQLSEPDPATWDAHAEAQALVQAYKVSASALLYILQSDHALMPAPEYAVTPDKRPKQWHESSGLATGCCAFCL